ncbi:aquaporin [Mycoplasma anserisalpingitidis]|uniref:aquaporin n=1 Tax=Mycoplasma anserisalpingitidis TaxID=519450 RepID=UPI0011B1C4D7|nr:aquaporin [Mycoplasma anserisalpingitidis]QDY87670.1 hypothetical protein FOY45_01895 [Mycoplasma anserisalpingitidis]
MNKTKYGIFDFFKFTKKRRQNTQEPANKQTWIKHAISEFIGTIFISMGLAGLSIYVGNKQIENLFLLHYTIVGFFAGFIVVGLCLFFFLRWSCDLNPAVTLTRYLNGTNTGRYALMKFAMQVLGMFAAAGIIYAIGINTSTTGMPNAPILADVAAGKAFDNVKSDDVMAGSTWIFFTELVMTAILLFPIFSPNINDKYRDLMIMFIISLSVWMGILGGSAAINPARGLAQQLPYLFNAASTGATVSNSFIGGTVAMTLGSSLAPVFYLFIQGITQKYVNPFVVYCIKFKNDRNNNMTTK